jgi:hypothetical protein
VKDVFGKAKETVSGSTQDDDVKTWLFELEQSRKREEGWRKDAERCVEIFEQEGSMDSTDLSDYNVLYANTETLAPSVYNNPPRPVVKRRIDKENPVAIAAAQVVKLVLQYLVDNPEHGKLPFDDLQKECVQEALVPGRGAACYYYEAAVGEGEYASVEGETVCGMPVPWNRFYHGYAKNWHQVPWIAYEYFMTREECVEQFGDAGKQIKLTHQSSVGDDKDKANQRPQDAEGMKFAHLYRIQDKATKTIFWVSEGYKSILDKKDDPLRLEGFFDCPRPIGFLRRISSLQPQTLYKMYQTQAEELDICSRRIRGILRAMKVRGLYDATIEGIEDLMKSPENTILPARNVSALANNQTLDKGVWMFPLETLVAVLQQLYASRQQIIATIHQLTGIADIMRGATQASETLGAQEMKQAWGTLKLKRMQKEVQRFSRDSLRMQAELACNHFGIETFIQMTGLKFPRRAEQQQAQLEMQQMQMQGAAMQAQGQPLDPQMQQQIAQRGQQIQQTLSQPSWEDIHEFLQNDSIRNYVIDIETNSTIDIEATEDKQELAEMMNSMSQLMNGVFPMVEQGILPFEAAKTLMLAVINKFRLGDEVEETFRAMQQPQPKEDPAMAKVKAEMERDKQKHELEQQDAQAEAQLKQAEIQLKQMENGILQEKLQMQAEFNKAEHAMKMQLLQIQMVAKATPPAVDPNKQQGGATSGDSNANP